MRLTIKRGLHFFFLYFVERYRLSSAFSWLCFVSQTLLPHSIFFSITCTLYHWRDYDKAVVVG